MAISRFNYYIYFFCVLFYGGGVFPFMKMYIIEDTE